MSTSTKPQPVSAVDTIAPEVLANAIIEINAAMVVINRSRLSRKALVVLIHDHSKVPKKTIELVLNNLAALSAIWLKPKIVSAAPTPQPSRF